MRASSYYSFFKNEKLWPRLMPESFFQIQHFSFESFIKISRFLSVYFPELYSPYIYRKKYIQKVDKLIIYAVLASEAELRELIR